MKYFFLLVFLFAGTARLSAQTATISALKFRPSPKFYQSADYTISYPVVHAKDKRISDKINGAIRTELIDAEYLEMSLNDAIKASLESGLTSMSYSVTFNRNGIYSLTVDAEGCGAYCSGWSRYFNFDLTTGEVLALNDLIKKESFNSLKEMVYAYKVNALVKYKEELPQIEPDSSTLHWALDEIDEHCIKAIRMDTYSLTDSTLEIKDKCEFPHAILSLSPDYVLSYDYKVMESYVEERYLEKLVGK